jgi:hypothetical protein
MNDIAASSVDREFIASLLKSDEAELYRRLGDPENWTRQEAIAPLRPAPARDPRLGVRMFSVKTDRVRLRTAKSVQEERQMRIKLHRDAEQALTWRAQNEQDPDKRASFERAAQVNMAMAQTLEALSREALEDVTTAYEESIRCEREISKLYRRQVKLEARRRRAILSKTQRKRDEQLAEVADRIEDLRRELKHLAIEQSKMIGDTNKEWRGLNEARDLLAEADGRDRFNKLVPGIRTRLCEQWHACEMIKQYQDETALAVAIGDVLVSLGGPVTTIAALVVRIGIKRFCNCPA